MIRYTPPSTADLQRLKADLGYTGNQMAELASVVSGSQWRKYTGGEQPRSVSLHMLFFMAARMALSGDELVGIGRKMVEIGAQLDPRQLIND